MLNWSASSRVMYCDTDNVMFLYDENNTLRTSPDRESDIEGAREIGIYFDNGLGMWEDEYSKYEYIQELVVAGPKSYTYRTRKDNMVCEQKGITIDRAN